MKKIACFVLTICLVFTVIGVMPTSAEETHFNNVNDVLALLKVIVNGETFDDEQVTIYDLNGDGAVTAADALVALKSFIPVLDVHIFLKEWRDDILDGKSIDFNVLDNYSSFNSGTRYYKDTPYNTAIVKSVAEWKELFGTYVVSEKYSYDFFKENALIIFIQGYVNSTPLPHTIDAISVADGELCIGIKVKDFNAGQPMVTRWTTHIEVKKTDVENVKKVTYFGELISE